MKLQIDNNDGRGLVDYTSAIDAARAPQVVRKLNQPSQLKFSVVANVSDFVAPLAGARVILGKASGQNIFTGYLMQAPEFEYLGWGKTGPAYRYDLVGASDEALLDEKRLPDIAPFVDRSAGNALLQLTSDVASGIVDTSGVLDVDTIASYAGDPQKTWTQQAAEIALEARATYRTLNGMLTLAPVGAATHALNETDANFSPQGLTLQPASALINDVTVIGEAEPQAYVTDYFIGDGLTERFYLSHAPFTKTSKTIFDEEYTDATLDPTRWNVSDPSGAISVAQGKLQVAGGTGQDGQTVVSFVEQIELGGALVLQHGDVMFNAASSGVIGGLYAGAVSVAGCLAGFRVSPNGTQSNIQALINGAAMGPVVATIAGHHYVMATRLYSQEMFRMQQRFHSSLHPAGRAYGGAAVAADVQIVLEIQDIDPTNPASQVAPATVLYDGPISSAPGFCTYALIDAMNLECSIAFTEYIQAIDTEVRTALPGQSYVTLLVGNLSEGAQCTTTSSELEFFSAYVPATNQQIEVRYRGTGRAIARVTNPASVTAQTRGVDNGVHGAVRHVKLPPARTASDCENAALAILDDTINPAWKGQYDTWSDFLPAGATDIFPGDALAINVSSRSANFVAIVNEIEITCNDLAAEHSFYKIKFANDAARQLGFEFEAAKIALPFDATELTIAQVGSHYIADLTAAAVTQITSTTVNIDAGVTPPAGGGIEVRWSDEGWGAYNDRNLLGRFATQTFTLPRLAKVQDYFLQQYDASNPPKYSRYSAALHVDYPL